VAKGCSQKYGVDYTDTFAPVCRYSSIRLILALAAELKLIVHQIDVTSAYLKGILNEEIYMIQPEKFVDKENPNKVCKLKKGLYGLKQAGREWNKKLHEILQQIGFKQCKNDNCIYQLQDQTNFVFIAVFVDDMLLTSTNTQ
jgi:hypothetical protein